MNLTVLGCHGPYPPAGGACSGYLLEHDGWHILLDCGNGVLSQLQQYINISELDAVVLSHLHSDHISDCFILQYALKVDYKRGLRNKPLPIYTPGDPSEDFNRLSGLDLCHVHPIKETDVVRIGPIQLSFRSTVHPISCLAVKLSADGIAETMVYSADTEYFEGMASFASNTSLFLCEANYLEKDLEEGAVNHMSAFQAATLGKNAQVNQLVLTHLPPFRNSADYLAEAKGVFNAVHLAKEGDRYYLNPSTHKKGEWAQLIIETNPIKASLLEGRLKSEGIPVMLRNDEAAGQIYGFTVGRLADIRVFVPQHKLQAAQKVLEQINSNDAFFDET